MELQGVMSWKVRRVIDILNKMKTKELRVLLTLSLHKMCIMRNGLLFTPCEVLVIIVLNSVCLYHVKI